MARPRPQDYPTPTSNRHQEIAMKYLLAVTALIATQAMACPDASKDAMAPSDAKAAVVAAKAKPAQSVATPTAKAVLANTTKVAAKQAEAKKTGS